MNNVPETERPALALFPAKCLFFSIVLGPAAYLVHMLIGYIGTTLASRGQFSEGWNVASLFFFLGTGTFPITALVLTGLCGPSFLRKRLRRALIICAFTTILLEFWLVMMMI